MQRSFHSIVGSGSRKTYERDKAKLPYAPSSSIVSYQIHHNEFYSNSVIDYITLTIQFGSDVINIVWRLC